MTLSTGRFVGTQPGDYLDHRCWLTLFLMAYLEMFMGRPVLVCYLCLRKNGVWMLSGFVGVTLSWSHFLLFCGESARSSVSRWRRYDLWWRVYSGVTLVVSLYTHSINPATQGDPKVIPDLHWPDKPGRFSSFFWQATANCVAESRVRKGRCGLRLPGGGLGRWPDGPRFPIVKLSSSHPTPALLHLWKETSQLYQMFSELKIIFFLYILEKDFEIKQNYTGSICR